MQGRWDRHRRRWNGRSMYSAARWLSASSTALVISSTNSGMPSVRATTSCRTFAGIGLLPATWSIMASISPRVSRLRVRAATCGCPIHGGSNSGRKVMSSSTGSGAIRSTARPKLPGSWDQPNAHPRRSSAPDFCALTSRPAQEAHPAFFAAVAAGLIRVSGSGHHLAATAFQQRGPHPDEM